MLCLDVSLVAYFLGQGQHIGYSAFYLTVDCNLTQSPFLVHRGLFFSVYFVDYLPSYLFSLPFSFCPMSHCHELLPDFCDQVFDVSISNGANFDNFLIYGLPAVVEVESDVIEMVVDFECEVVVLVGLHWSVFFIIK